MKVGHYERTKLIDFGLHTLMASLRDIMTNIRCFEKAGKSPWMRESRWSNLQMLGHLKIRVAKCHRYGGRYICVKISEGWSKKWRRPHSFVKWSKFGVNYTNFYEVLLLNKLCLIKFSALSPRPLPVSFWFIRISQPSWIGALLSPRGSHLSEFH